MSANLAGTTIVVGHRVDPVRNYGLTDPLQRLVCLTAPVAIGTGLGLVGYLFAFLIARILEVELAREPATLAGCALLGAFLGMIDVAYWWRRNR